jgi:putative MFS transporter
MANATKWLFWLLGIVVVVEGFDTNVANVVLPYVGDTFTAAASELRNAQALIALGAVAAYFTIQSADRWGRRPVLLAAVVAFSVLSLATAAAQDLRQFVILQFLARIALVTQLTIAYVLLSESMPATRRGRVNGMLAAFASVGAALPALLLHRWLPPDTTGADSSCSAVCHCWCCRCSGAGSASLRRFCCADSRAALHSRSPPTAEAAGTGPAPAFPERQRLVVRDQFLGRRDHVPVQLLCGARARLDRGRSAARGAVWLDLRLRRLCRRRTPDGCDRTPPAAAVLLVLGGIATLVTFGAESFIVVAAGWVCLQALQGIWPVAYTLTTELFPTEVRASANGLAHNLLGRWGQVAGPFAVNLVALELGTTGRAVAALACVNVLALPLLRWGLPETRQTELSEREARTRVDLNFARIADCSIAQSLRRRFDTIDGEPRGRSLGRRAGCGGR